MKRVIVDFKKLNKEILEMLVAKFPNGYEAKDIIVFRNAQNEIIEAVEVKTEDTIYLVKVSKRLADTMENYDEDDDMFENDEEGGNNETPEMADEDSDDY
ncbi:MAG: hypothetical protein R2776_05670 [Flavobacteriaceae bacterium]|nr:hypothetical protein [Flavobacteriaceae bacterium]